jgi:hypothetical protein
MTTLTRTEMMRDALDKAIEERDSANRRADKAESELFALGIQVEALKARLRLAEACINAADFVINDSRVKVDGVNAYLAARAAFDAVPGDVVADVEPPDTRPRYASGEVPMVGDVFQTDLRRVVVDSLDRDGDPVDVDGEAWASGMVSLIRRAAPPAPSQAETAWEVVEELADSAAEVDALRAQVASLTIQRDAAEALARERASERDEALAILRGILAAEASGDLEALADLHVRARKLVGP